MIKLSLAMIVKNEEHILERCLTSIKDVVDEIIIVDTGSTDNTKNIAKKFTNKIYDFEWMDDFAKARNFSFSKCTGDYILWLDADDILSKKSKNSIKKLKNTLKNKEIDVVMMKYDISFDENNNPIFSYYRERILKNNQNFVWKDFVHETITPHGNIFYSNISIEHRPQNKEKQSDRNLKIYEKQLSLGTKFSARQQYYYSRELMYNKKYNEAIENFNKLLNRTDVWIENFISACIDLCFCYSKLNEILKAKQSLVKTFAISKPRSEVCCKLGNLFLQEQNFCDAIFYYKLALKDKPNLKSGAFVQKIYYKEYPYLMLCYSYHKLENYKKAKYYFEKLGKVNPKNINYINNKTYFENIKY